jgi:hypothetical protein
MRAILDGNAICICISYDLGRPETPLPLQPPLSLHAFDIGDASRRYSNLALM